MSFKTIFKNLTTLFATLAIVTYFLGTGIALAAGGVDDVDDHAGCGDTPASERNTHDYFDCCAETASCPHWILTDGATFAAASDPDGVRTRSDNVEAAGICAAASQVVWVGRDANGNNVIDNDEGAASGQHKQNTTSFLYGHDHVDVYSGEWNTVRTEVMAALGLDSDRTLAFFCPEMINEQVGKIEPPDVSQTTCALDTTLYAGKRYGNSGSRTYMKHTRSDASDSEYETTTSATKLEETGVSTGKNANNVTYARPGDHIKFEDKYCYGAQGVKGSTPTSQTAKITTAQSNNNNTKNGLDSWDHNNSYNQSSSGITSGETKTSTNQALNETDAGTNINSKFEFNSVRSWIKHMTSLAAANGTDAMKSADYPWHCGKDSSFTASSSSTLSSWSAAIGASYSFNSNYSTGGTYYGKFNWGCNSSKPREFASGYSGTVYKWKTKPDPGSLGDLVGTGSGVTYEVSNSTKANITTNMTAVIPYNFDTSLSASLGDGSGIVSAGEGVNLKYTVNILKRINTDVDGDTDYRTWTPDYTKVQAVRFIIPADAADYDPNFETKLSGGITSASAGACPYYTGRLSGISIDCKSLYHYATEDADIAAAIPTHNLRGPSEMTNTGILKDNDGSHQYTFRDMAVPDAPGAKFCIALAVYPADSHNLANDFSGTHADDTVGLTVPSTWNALNAGDVTGRAAGDKQYNGQHNHTSPNWRISGATCATIAKKSNLQVWGSTYTNSGADTLISRKRYAENPGTYGTFADGAIVAKQSVTRMASASVLGYTNILSYFGGYGGTSQTPYCDSLNSWSPGISLSSLIVGKADYCQNDDDEVKPSTTASTIRDNSANYREALKDRFVDSGQTVCSGTKTYATWDDIKNDTSTCVRKKTYHTNSVTGNSIYYRIRANTVNLGSSDKPSDSAAAGHDPDHNAKIASSIEIPAGVTLIIQADNINIIGNICYGSSAPGSNENGCNVNATTYKANAKTIIKARNDENYGEIARLPQALLFANNNINIRKEVFQVDSWLISNGAVKTCDWDAGTRNVIEYDAAGNEVGTKAISAEKAEDCARLLMINGPVLSNSSTLRRSGGSFSNTPSLDGFEIANATTNKGYKSNLGLNGSVTPAEIMNLRPDVYMWSYWQAQQYTQAVSSYTRELAPRL